MIYKKGFILSPLILVLLFSLFVFVYIHITHLERIHDRGLEQKFELSQAIFSKDVSELNSQNLLASLFLNATSFLFSLGEIEDHMNLHVEGVFISEEGGVLRINSSNATVVLGLPYSELLDVELPTSEIQSCLLGCRCEDLSYLAALESCLDSVGGPYIFSFDQAVGCFDSEFELPIFVSKQNNTLSITYPIPLENGSLFKFSC